MTRPRRTLLPADRDAPLVDRARAQVRAMRSFRGHDRHAAALIEELTREVEAQGETITRLLSEVTGGEE